MQWNISLELIQVWFQEMEVQDESTELSYGGPPKADIKS